MSSSIIQATQVPISVNKKFLNANDAYRFLIKGKFFIPTYLQTCAESHFLRKSQVMTLTKFLLHLMHFNLLMLLKKKNFQKKIFSL
jgi:hypothetical protein